jgi:histidinol-phosphatase (PHP family)
MLTNYHTHCYLDDGRGHPREYAEAALARGFYALGFSCHAPLPYPNEWALKDEDLPLYIQLIEELKEEFQGRLEINLGLETDYIPDVIGPSHSKYSNLPLEYKIGSVHSLRDRRNGEEISIDNSIEDIQRLLEHSYDGSIRALCEDYFSRQIKMLREHRFDILAHCDLVRKLNAGNRFFDPGESWYREMARGMLDEAARAQVVVEVNTGAIARGYTSEFYPSYDLLRYAAEKKIPLTLNADAHVPEKISEAFIPSLSIIAEAGYTSLMYLKNGAWVEASI